VARAATRHVPTPTPVLRSVVSRQPLRLAPVRVAQGPVSGRGSAVAADPSLHDRHKAASGAKARTFRRLACRRRHCRCHPGSGEVRRRVRVGLVPEASPVLVPSPQNASIRSGSSDCCDGFGGIVRANDWRARTAAPPDRRDGTGGISGTGTLRAVNGLHPANADDTPDAIGRGSTPALPFVPSVTDDCHCGAAPWPGGAAPRRRRS
jgi:hypothetical protein